MTKVKLVSALVIAILAVIVILQNTATMETKLLFMTIEMPRAALLGLTLLIGIAVGVFSTLAVTARRARSVETAEPENTVQQ